MRRWPYRPAPRPGETLASWLDGLAEIYLMTRKEFIFEMCGLPSISANRLNDKPPDCVVEALLCRTSLTLEEIDRTHSLGGLRVPSSFDLAEYIGEETVLISQPLEREASGYQAKPWIRAARRRSRIQCPACSADTVTGYERIWWRLPLISSCPEHGLLLRKRPNKGQEIDPEDDDQRDMPSAPDALIELDRKTIGGLCSGVVRHAGREIPVDRWAQLMRIMVHELCNYEVVQGWYERGILDAIWSNVHARRPPRRHRPAQIETLHLHQQQNIMGAVARAVEMFEHSNLGGEGSAAHELRSADFKPEPREPVVHQAAAAALLREMRYLPWEEQENFFYRIRSRPRLWLALKNLIGTGFQNHRLFFAQLLVDHCSADGDRDEMIEQAKRLGESLRNWDPS